MVLCFLAGSAHAELFSVPVGDAEIPVSRFEARGRLAVLWLPSEFGVVDAERALAAALAKQGIEVWLADLFAARFLPIGPSSAERIPAGDIAELIRRARATGKRVVVVTSGRGAKYAFEGASLVPPDGFVLLYPNLYAAPPEAGSDPQYLPVVAATRRPIVILQGERSPWYWTRDSLQSALETAGSKVRIVVLPAVRDRFYFRPDATSTERAMADRLPQRLVKAIAWIGRTEHRRPRRENP